MSALITPAPKFVVGDAVHYAHHGFGLVVSLDGSLQNNGDPDSIRVLILKTGMVLRVPLDATETAGVTRVQLHQVMDDLRYLKEVQAVDDENTKQLLNEVRASARYIVDLCAVLTV